MSHDIVWLIRNESLRNYVLSGRWSSVCFAMLLHKHLYREAPKWKCRIDGIYKKHKEPSKSMHFAEEYHYGCAATQLYCGLYSVHRKAMC